MATQDTQLYLETPTLASGPLGRRTGFKVYLKMENLQPPGSFKIRGISNYCKKAVFERGCTHLYCASGGNAGLATAYVSQQLNVACTIVLPEVSPKVVHQKIEDLGAEVLVHGQVWNDANNHAIELAKSPGCEVVPPFDHPDVWEGHESMLSEAQRQMPQKPDVVITCVGGGGLLAGVVQGMAKVGWKDVPVIAMETEGTACFYKSVAANKRIRLSKIDSVAVCLGALEVCERAFQLYQQKEAEILSEVVSDREAINACLQFADDHRVLVEPACGAALAALYSDVIPKLQGEGRLGGVQTVLLIVCGGSSTSLELLDGYRKQFDL